jgi:hypothetical protein
MQNNVSENILAFNSLVTPGFNPITGVSTSGKTSPQSDSRLATEVLVAPSIAFDLLSFSLPQIRAEHLGNIVEQNEYIQVVSWLDRYRGLAEKQQAGLETVSFPLKSFIEHTNARIAA